MPKITGPLTINNGATTPVAKSFQPRKVGEEAALFSEKTATSSAGYVNLGVSFSMASTKRPTNRTDISLDLPVMQTIGGVTSVAHVGRFKGYFVVPEAMDDASRKDLVAYVGNSLLYSAVGDVVRGNEPAY